MSWNTIEIEIIGAEMFQVLLWRLLLLTSWLDYITNWIPGRQDALWPCPRPLPCVQNGVSPRETSDCGVI